MEIDEEVLENDKTQSNVLATIQTPYVFIQRLKKKEESDKL